MATQSDKSFEEVATQIRQHLDERGWLRHAGRGLAISIALEASELLEHYQWDDEAVGDKQAIAGELADIIIYAFQFADSQDIDIAEAIGRKLASSAQKYPLSEFSKDLPQEERQANWLKRKARMTGDTKEENSNE